MGQIVLDSYEGALIIKALIGILFVAGVLGNALVILSVLRNRSMKTVMHYLLLNLAIADTLVAIFLVMRYVFTDMMEFPGDVRADIICKFVSFGTISWVGLQAQVFTLMVISFERYSAVVHPHNIRGRLTKRKLKIVVVGCWIYAIGFIIPDFIAIRYDFKKESCVYEWAEIIQKTWAFLWFFTCGPVPLFTMGFLYGRVVYDLWIKKGRVSESRKAVIQSRKRITKVVITVTVIYAVCWLPNLTLWLMSNFMKQLTYIVFLITLTHVFLLFNSSVNPFVYSIQSQHFRKCMLRSLFFWKPRNSVTRELQDTNTNTGTSVHDRCDKTRNIECQSSAFESRMPSGIVQEPHESLETRKRSSVGKRDSHANKVHPANSLTNENTTGNQGNCSRDVNHREQDLLTIEKGFENNEQQTQMGEIKDKDFNVFQVNVSTVKASGSDDVEQRHVFSVQLESQKVENYGGIWMGLGDAENQGRGDFTPSMPQRAEEKSFKEKSKMSFLKFKAISAFTGKKSERNDAGLVETRFQPSLLNDSQPTNKKNSAEKNQRHQGTKKLQGETSKKGIEPENQTQNEDEIAFSKTEKHVEIVEPFSKTSFERSENENHGKSLIFVQNALSVDDRQETIDRKKISFQEETEPKKQLILPRINRAGTPLVTARPCYQNKEHEIDNSTEKRTDKGTWLQEKEKLKLLRNLRELDITK